MRWTQAHSVDALMTCKDIIYEVKELNKGRDEKISIVFVVRTFDLENDNYIRGLFQEEYADLVIEKFAINELSDTEVNEIVGSQYLYLPKKLQKVLKIPINIYIWQHLDEDCNYDSCSTTSHLIDTWWKQIVDRYITIFNDDKDLTNAKTNIVKLFESKNKLSLPKSVVLTKCSTTILDFLCNNGFLVLSDNKVSFAHQSIIDYFLSESMVIKYHEGNDIIDIIGGKEIQTPVRRYQVQMCMQQLLEDDTEYFIDFGNKLLDSENIRFSYKFLFFELLNQIEEIDEVVEEFIIDKCEDELWDEYIINNVIMGKIHYVTILLDNNVLENWYDDSEKKNIVFNILSTVNDKFTKDIVNFIDIRILLNKEDDIQFLNVLHYLNVKEQEDVFVLRMKLYNVYYAEISDYYVDFKTLFNNNYKIALEYLKFLLETKEKGIDKKNKINIKEIDDFIEIECDDIEEKSEYIINYLISSIPEKPYTEIEHRAWEAYNYNSDTLERGCVKLIKGATANLAKKSPESFFEIYYKYMDKNYALFNEIILTAFYELPDDYADKIIEYLCSNFENIIFDYTSDNVDELYLTKKIINKFACSCSDDVYVLLEDTIYSYYQRDTVARYKYRREYTKTHRVVYWSFWGELQYELLNELPIERLSNKAIQLAQVLKRKFPYGTSCYKKNRVESFSSISPIKEKVLNEKNWKEILTSRNIKEWRDSAIKKMGLSILTTLRIGSPASFATSLKKIPKNILNWLPA